MRYSILNTYLFIILVLICACKPPQTSGYKHNNKVNLIILLNYCKNGNSDNIQYKCESIEDVFSKAGILAPVPFAYYINNNVYYTTRYNANKKYYSGPSNPNSFALHIIKLINNQYNPNILILSFSDLKKLNSDRYIYIATVNLDRTYTDYLYDINNNSIKMLSKENLKVISK